jgi:formylglycine-generating enzyme required for sulfatase activity
VRFIVRDGTGTREERRVPGGGVPFRDRWEHEGKLVSGPEMVVIPPGEFMMGSPTDEPGRNWNEGPQHLVTIAQAFAVGRYAVTFDEWDFAQADSDWHPFTGIGPRKPEDFSYGRGNRPVIHVNWDDAQAYVEWLRAKTRQDYRLLSEAEWEYCCRAGMVTPFWWGSSITPAQANYDEEEEDDEREAGERCGEPVPVDRFGPNPFGLYQMHGNVCEWVEDRWCETYDGAPDDGTAWITGDRDSYDRVLRGGCWSFFPSFLRAACRFTCNPVYRTQYYGFRLARTLNL